MLEFLIGLVLGGTISWAVTHRYSTRSSDERNNRITLVDYASYPLEDVWNFISNPSNFHKFCHNRSNSFGHTNVRVGSAFVTYPNNGTAYNQFIVEWNPPHEIAWGHTPDDWSYRIRLTDQGEKTEICLTRSFRHQGWWEILLTPFLPNEEFIPERKSLNDLTKDTLKRLIRSLDAKEI